MAIQRYPADNVLSSSQNGFSDLLDWLSFLTAKEYLHSLLVGTHGVSGLDAERRCSKIMPHVRIAAAYIRQSQEGPPELSFLPAYYAILNLMKVCVLFGPRHGDLANNRWHGVTYNPQGKDSRSVMTEEIVLKAGGVFPLYYETLTGMPFGSKAIRLRISDFLRCVSGVQFEYYLASKEPHSIVQLGFDVQNIDGERRLRCLVRAANPTPKGHLQCMGNFRMDKNNRLIYIGPLVPNTAPHTVVNAIRASLKTELLYKSEPQHTYAMMSQSKLLLPQELPIALLFFYMSSIVRYRPEYFARLRDSRYWPVLSSARVHSFLEFLVAFWSFTHRQNFFINSAPQFG